MKELEKILEEIEAEHSYKVPGNYDSYSQYNEAWSDAIYRVRARLKEFFQEKDNDGWIPVEERLPEDGTYLCTLAGELCGIEEPFTGMCGIENGIWDEPDCVIAWRPLPEPYHPERSNDEKK